MGRAGTLLKISMALASFLVALLVAEATLRAFTPDHFGQSPFPGLHHWMAEDPILGFANRPSFEHNAFEINERGYRGPPLRTESPPPTRIVCLGDSGTFGLWVEKMDGAADAKRIRYDNYPEELGRILAERGERTEVINAGVVGYTAAHGLRLLNTRVLALDPDVVTLRFGLNDHKITSRSSGRLVREPDSPLLRRTLYGFHDWRLVRIALAAWRRADWARPGGDREVVRMATPQQFAKTLRRFAALSRERGFELLFIDYPLRPRAWGEDPHYAKVYMRAGYTDLASFHEAHRRYQGIVRRVADEEGIALLATGELLTNPEDPGFGPMDFVHPDRRGAKLLAAQLADTLTARGWPAGAGDE